MPGEGDGVEKAYTVMKFTHFECVKHLNLFNTFQPTIQWPSLLTGMDLTRFVNFKQNFLTTYVSNPVFEHFKKNGPEYISYVKATHHPDDGWIRWAQKGAYNTAIDVVAKYAHLAINPVQIFLRDVGKKIPKETLNALDPSHLLVLSTHHHLIQKYLAQRVDQLTTPIQYWQDFHGAFQNTVIRTKGAFTNLREHVGVLEGGPMARSAQLTRVIIDMTEQTIAAKLGVALALFTLFQVPSIKKKTQASFDHLFPRRTVHGTFGRMIPVRFLFSRPLAKIVGNPVLSIAVITYMMTISMARTIKDSLEFEQKHPKIFERLKGYNREVVNSQYHLKYLDTVEDLNKKKI